MWGPNLSPGPIPYYQQKPGGVVHVNGDPSNFTFKVTTESEKKLNEVFDLLVYCQDELNLNPEQIRRAIQIGAFEVYKEVLK